MLLSNADRVYRFHVFQLLPLLVHSLSLPDPELKAATIATFTIITTDTPHIIQEHVQTVLPAMLRLSQTQDNNTIASSSFKIFYKEENIYLEIKG